jgi:hypothetical protein
MGMTIKIAAVNSCINDKEKADIICSGKFDEKVINEQIAKLTTGGTIYFFDGDYYIDSFEEEENKLSISSLEIKPSLIRYNSLTLVSPSPTFIPGI